MIIFTRVDNKAKYFDRIKRSAGEENTIAHPFAGELFDLLLISYLLCWGSLKQYFRIHYPGVACAFAPTLINAEQSCKLNSFRFI